MNHQKSFSDLFRQKKMNSDQQKPSLKLRLYIFGVGTLFAGAFALSPYKALALEGTPTTLASSTNIPAATSSTSSLSTAAVVPASGSELSSSASAPTTGKVTGLRKYIGVNYFTFFDGPGVGGEITDSPSELGIASDRGWMLWTNLSVRGKITERFAIDYQARLEQIVSNDFEFRNQGGRLGVSGKLLKGDQWALNGAFNSDIPGVGAIPTGRTLVVNPGLFSTFTYNPRASRWSVFALVTPRYFIYRDPDAMAAQDIIGRLPPGTKPEIVIQMNPSLNYAFNDRQGLRAGIVVDFRKNANQDSMGRWFAPIDVGYTHEFSKAFSIYPHMRVSGPWDDGIRRQIAGNRRVPTQAEPWTDTLSFGMWLSGTLF